MLPLEQQLPVSNLAHPQVTPSPSIPLATQQPQFDALHADTDLVTIGIGGNDDSVFGDLTGTCPTLRADDPTGAPCQAHYTANGVDTMAAAVRATGRNVAKFVKGVKDRSPAATIVLVGCPRLLPPTGTCPCVIPFADGDYAWAGGAAWVNGQSTDIVEAVAYHPFRAGMEAEAKLIDQELGVYTSAEEPTPKSKGRPRSAGPDRAPHGSVRISAPSAVTTRVCSNWAVHFLSFVVTVQLSSHTS